MNDFGEFKQVETIKPEETIKQAEELVKVVTERINGLKQAISEAEQKLADIQQRIESEQDEARKQIFIQGQLFISSLLAQARQELKEYTDSLPQDESLLKAAKGLLN